MSQAASRSATVIYNPQAGAAPHVSIGALERELRSAGYESRMVCLRGDADLDVLRGVRSDVVVAAGGDGTVRAVARRLLEEGAPLAIVPLGTSNNIAVSLGLGDLAPLDVVAGLARPRPTRLDVGVADGPWGRAHFLESAGVGLFADLLAAYRPEAGKSAARAAESVFRVLLGYTPRSYRLRLDGEELSDQYILVEVMNTSRVAWRTPLAPNADPCDGLLDLVLVREDQRFGFASYLMHAIAGQIAGHPAVSVRRCRQVDLTWDDAPVHIDEDVHQADSVRAGSLVSFTLAAGVVDVWLPGAHQPALVEVGAAVGLRRT